MCFYNKHTSQFIEVYYNTSIRLFFFLLTLKSLVQTQEIKLWVTYSAGRMFLTTAFLYLSCGHSPKRCNNNKVRHQSGHELWQINLTILLTYFNDCKTFKLIIKTHSMLYGLTSHNADLLTSKAVRNAHPMHVKKSVCKPSAIERNSGTLEDSNFCTGKTRLAFVLKVTTPSVSFSVRSYETIDLNASFKASRRPSFCNTNIESHVALSCVCRTTSNKQL